MSVVLRLLIIEDSDDDLMLVIREFKNAGYDIDYKRVDNAIDLQEALKSNFWDLIICDYSLPNFSGIGALKIYKEKKLGIPFIVVSGNIGEETAVEMMKAGANDYIMKNNLKRLIPAVERELEDYKIRKEKIQAENSFIESEEKYKSLYKDNNAVMLIIDKENLKIVDANASACKFYGYIYDKIVRLRISDIDVLHKTNFEKNNYVKYFISKHKIANDEIKDVEIYCGSIKIQGKNLLYLIVHDISDRIKAENDLKESEEKYKLLINNLGEGVALVDFDENVIYSNHAANEIFGINNNESLIGYNLNNFLDLNTFNIVKEQTKLRINGIKSTYEIVIKSKDNLIKTLIVTGNPYYEKGVLIGTLGIFRDISEKIKQENTIKESENKFRTYYEHSPISIFIVNSIGNYILVNPAACNLLKYSTEELLDLNIKDISHKESLIKNFKQFDKLVNEGSFFDFETILLKKDKTPVNVILNAVKLSNNEFMAFCIDITDRKKSERALQESEEKLRAIIESSIDAIIVIDNTAKITLFNPAAEDLFRYSSSEVLNKHFGILIEKENSLIHQIRMEHVLQHNMNKFGHVDKRIEGKLRRKDGSIFDGEIAMSTGLVDKNVFIVTSITDITERKQIENKLLNAIIETEEKEKKRFAEDLHDGLIPLLSSVKIYVSLFNSIKYNKEEKEDLIRYTSELIDESIHTCRTVANDLMPQLLIDYGLSTAIKSFSDKIVKSGKVNIEINSKNFTEKFNPVIENNLYRITNELINNSIRHGLANNIHIELENNENILSFTYSDDGKGFDMNKVLWSPDSGNGLRNIRSRVKSINGNADITSEPGKGIKVVITIKL